MALALYMDVHVPAAVTEGLRKRGVDVLTSQDDGTREIDDEGLLQQATSLGRLLFTQDQDLLQIAAKWQRTKKVFPGIIFAPQIAISIGVLIEDLELIAQCGTREDVESRVVFLPLK